MQPFEEYWSKEAVQRGLKTGELIQVQLYTVLCDNAVHRVLIPFQGELRINQRNYEDAYVDDPVQYSCIYYEVWFSPTRLRQFHFLRENNYLECVLVLYKAEFISKARDSPLEKWLAPSYTCPPPPPPLKFLPLDICPP